MTVNTFLTFIVCFFISNISFSQGWFDDNPKWTNNMLGSSIIDGIQTLTVVGDTLIAGQNCKILNRNRQYKKIVNGGDTVSYNENSYRFAYEEDDKVYFYDFNYEVFQYSYDFSLEVGEDMIFVPDWVNCEPDTLEVYEKGVISFDGVDLRYQKLLFHQENNIIELKNIIEKIGYYQDEIIDSNNVSSTSYPFPYLNMHYHFDCVLSEPPPNPICFQNDQFEFNFTNASCEGETTSFTTEQNLIGIIKLFPNPFKDKIQIKNLTPYPIKGFIVYDLLGNVISSKQTNCTSNELVTMNISNIKNGVYFVKILLNNGEFITKRVIKQ